MRILSLLPPLFALVGFVRHALVGFDRQQVGSDRLRVDFDRLRLQMEGAEVDARSAPVDPPGDIKQDLKKPAKVALS